MTNLVRTIDFDHLALGSSHKKFGVWPGHWSVSKTQEDFLITLYSFFLDVLLESLGIEDDTIIGDGQLTSSSADSGHAAWRGRLHGKGSWKPDKGDPAPVYKVTFNSPVNISYIATQGAQDDDCWVTSFMIKYKLEHSQNDFKNYSQVGNI